MGAHRSDDQGAIAVIVALSLVAIFGFAALAVDVGYWYDTRHQLQAAADAAALAGCSVLIETEDAAAADAAARDYAQRNASGAGAGLRVDTVDVDMASDPWSVRVVVARDVEGWFSPVVGLNGRAIHADAKAIKAQLSGARYLMPWAIPIIRDEDVDRIEARVVSDGGSTISGPAVLSNTAARTWEGALAAPSTAGGYDVMVTVYNIFGIAEWVGDSKGEQPASRVMVNSASYPFASISLVDDYEPTDEAPAITINVTTKVDEPNVNLKVGKKNKVKMNGSGTSWSYTITDAELSYGDDFLETYPVDIYTGGSADGLVDAYVHMRRSTFPFKSVYATPGVSSAGASVWVTVNLNEFDPTVLVPGQIYTLRVGSEGVETGNFGEINYAKIEHDTGFNTGPCPPDPVGVPLGTNVKDWVMDGYGGGVHVGDILPLSPGKSGWTPNVVEDRIAEHGDIVILPVVTKYEQKSGGTYDVIVRKFAAMRIIDWGSSGGAKGTVEAEFIEYVATPSSYGGGGGSGGGTAYAPRLVNP